MWSTAIEVAFREGREEIINHCIVFVSAGYGKNTKYPLRNRIAVRAQPGDTFAKLGKMIRKSAADELRCKPSDLWWAVYESADSWVPMRESANYPAPVYV